MCGVITTNDNNNVVFNHAYIRKVKLECFVKQFFNILDESHFDNNNQNLFFVK